MDAVKLKTELVRYEGYSNVVYADSMNNPTVGIGHMDKHLVIGDIFTDMDIDEWFQVDISNATRTANSFVSLSILDDCRARIITNLAFNMGSRLLQFLEMKMELLLHNWIDASNELQNSTWYNQVGVRGVEMCWAMKNGFYAWEGK